MTAHLLELSFGPVQSFIASARRSRDLWAGSYILSEIARAAGNALLDANAELIYPATGRIKHDNHDENSNLSNVLLARLPNSGAAQARMVAQAAITASRKRLSDFAAFALNDWQNAGVAVREDIWHLQIADALEAYAAWSELRDDATDYKDAYLRLKTAFAARKNTRGFGAMNPPDAAWGDTPKNSFDGLRESVLPKERNTFPTRFGLSKGEQLDALGCIKRVEGRKESFTALTRLAAHDWLAVLPEEKLKTLRDVYEPLCKLDLATRTKNAAYARFTYDAGLLYPERLELEKNAIGENAEIKTALDNLENVLKPLWREYGRPCPYAVLVVADGDRMGVFVDQAKSAEDHKEITQAVANFADQVPGLAQASFGHSVFNGGEDLTVMYPLSGVVEGGKALSAAFDQSMEAVAKRLLGNKYAIDRPTLRVGAAICHVLEPLGVIRQWADAAEKFAKGEIGVAAQGNALGLVLHVRAGHEIGVRIGFNDAAAFAALNRWQKAYTDGAFPGRLAYDCRAIALDCEARGLSADVAEAELVRLLDRARERGGGQAISIDQRIALNGRRAALAPDQTDPTGLKRLADELILARWLSAKSARDISNLEGAGQ
jgi:CRISPR-associated protein Cmr2